MLRPVARDDGAAAAAGASAEGSKGEAGDEGSGSGDSSQQKKGTGERGARRVAFGTVAIYCLFTWADTGRVRATAPSLPYTP